MEADSGTNLEAAKSRLLMLCRQSPYGSSYAREALDIALAASAFDVKVSLLFLNDGVLQLLKGQNTQASGRKNVEALLGALELYEIDPVWADEESLAARRLAPEHLIPGVQPRPSADIAELCKQYDRVLTL